MGLPNPLETARQLGGFGRFLLERDRRAREDAQSMHELSRVDLRLPAGLELEWLGVAGYRLAFEGHTLYIDPYVSRVPLSAVLRREPAQADAKLHERFFGGRDEHVVGVLVGHTHFDHAVDVPALARSTGANAYGSRSLVNLMSLHGLGAQAVAVQPHRPYELAVHGDVRAEP